jgi:MFS transporter, DHA1 family, multidrug resistance protein
MDNVDEFVERAERDASPNRFPGGDEKVNEKVEESGATLQPTTSSASSSSSSSSDSTASTVTRRSQRSRANSTISRVRTQTEISRIETHRSQHSATVGRALTSKLSQRLSKLPLPSFGANKPYPAMLPNREEYVVEFDDEDDPLHGQNWPMKKK